MAETLPRRFFLPQLFTTLCAIVVATVIAGCNGDGGQGESAESVYETRLSADGTTEVRYYMGRQIADLPLSEHSSIWLDRPERDTEELPLRLIRGMNLRPAMVVADIGAGTGFFTFRLAQQVPSGRVVAVDVQPAMLDTVRARMAREGVRNVQPVLGSVDNPSLAERTLDVALIVASYHEFSHPREMSEHILNALKPGGRLIVVEYRAEDPTIPVPDLHRMSADQIVRELQASGFAFLESKDILPQQHFLVFRRPVEEM